MSTIAAKLEALGAQLESIEHQLDAQRLSFEASHEGTRAQLGQVRASLDALAAADPNDSEAADRVIPSDRAVAELGISKPTLYEWRKRGGEWREAIKKYDGVRCLQVNIPAVRALLEARSRRSA